MDAPGKEKENLKVAYRRNNIFEALRLFLVTFALAVIFHVAWDAAFEETISFESSFWRSLAFSAAFGVSSMMFKLTPVYLR